MTTANKPGQPHGHHNAAKPPSEGPAGKETGVSDAQPDAGIASRRKSIAEAKAAREKRTHSPQARRDPSRLDLPRRSMPDDVRAAMAGRIFMDWGSFRRAVNMAWSKSPSIRNDPFFTKENIARMRRGSNPVAPLLGQAGKSTSMEYDHLVERQDDPGKTFDVDNLSLRTPLSHRMKLRRKFNIASGSLSSPKRGRNR